MPADEATAAEVRQEIERLLPQRGVLVVALDETASVVPVPSCVPCPAQPMLASDGALDQFLVDDHPEVLRIWFAAKEHGAAMGQVRLVSRPDETITLRIADLRASYGVFLALLAGVSLGPEDIRLTEGPDLAPRLCVFRIGLPMMAIVDVDEAAPAILGWSREELLAQKPSEFVHPDDQRGLAKAFVGTMQTGVSRRIRTRRLHKDGSWRWMEATYEVHRDGDDPHMLVQMIDISDEMAALAALHEREILLRKVTEALPEGLFQVDAGGRVVYANDRLYELLWAERSERVGDLLTNVAGEGRREFESAITGVLADGLDRALEVDVVLTKAFRSRRCQVSVRTLGDSDGARGSAGAVVWVLDVTEATRRRTELEERATYDALTRCHNRASVMAILEQALTRRGGARVAAFFIDIDSFKPINDRFGHAAGDELLVSVARRLHSALRGDDVLGRIGGDEFLVVCHDVVADVDTEAVGERLRTALAEPFVIAGEAVDVACSVGVSHGDSSTSAEELLRQADAAMYVSKRQGQGGVVLYRGELEVPLASSASDATGAGRAPAGDGRRGAAGISH